MPHRITEMDDEAFAALERENTREYIESLVRAYRETGDLHRLDGSSREGAEAMAACIDSLLRPYSINTIFDLGCGTGYLLKLLVERRPNLVPFGVDANPVALEVLATEVLPSFAGNFETKDWDLDEITIRTDAAILMSGTVSVRHLNLRTRYLLIRSTILQDEPRGNAFRSKKAQHLRRYLRENHRVRWLASEDAPRRHSRTCHSYSLFLCETA